MLLFVTVNLTILGLFALSIASCSDDDPNRGGYDETGNAYSNDAGILYYTENDFLLNKREGYYLSKERNLLLTSNTSSVYLFIDARREDGFSTWNNPLINKTADNYDDEDQPFSNDSFEKLEDYEETQVDEYDDDGEIIRDETLVIYDVYSPIASKIPFSSPPTHLHLCLDNYNENPVNAIPSKTWVVQEITDKEKPGSSALKDPNWINFSDNEYTFEKTSKLKLYMGIEMSDDEKDFFKDKDSGFATYAVTGTKIADTKIIISFGASTYKQEFKIIESNWNKIKFETSNFNERTNKTQVAEITIVPKS